MASNGYHPPWSHLLHPVTCEHPDCSRPATHDRDAFRFCLDHFLFTLMWDQDRDKADVA